MDAMILVGGKGERLKSIVPDRPKPMAEVAGRPFVEWLVLFLHTQGIKRVIFCTGYMSEVIEGYFRDGKDWGMEIVYSREPMPLGTSGAVRYALDKVHSERFLVLNGDSFCRFDLNRLNEAHLARRASLTLWLVGMEDCSRYGAVDIGDEDIVKAFREKTEERRAGLVNAGIYLLERRTVKSIPEGKAVSMETEFIPAMVGHGLYAVVGNGPLIDIGIPETYALAKQYFTTHEQPMWIDEEER